MGTKGKQFFIAIVDDEAAVREATESLLRSAGLPAETFASAEDFLRSPYRDRAGCLILDVGLPGMSGLELQRLLTANGEQIPIVFITAHEGRHDQMKAQALQAGAVKFLRKPFSEEDLLSAVRSSIRTDD
jgi:FixJ family two-component response regulator